MSRYQFIEQVAATEPVQVLCRVLAVSAAGYYQWLSRATRPTPAWEPAASAAFSRHARRYGTRRLRAELRAEGHTVGRYALRTWLPVAAARPGAVRRQAALAIEKEIGEFEVQDYLRSLYGPGPKAGAGAPLTVPQHGEQLGGTRKKRGRQWN